MILWEKISMMFTTIADQRIARANKAMLAAQNPEFKKFWQSVVNELQAKKISV
jgi:hypothetical protein